MNNRYDEIINLPHHVSKTRPQMPMSDRAAQFAPFAALTGYESAIKETGRLTDERIELDEGALTALNMRYQLLMDALDEEPEVEITYFKPDERKAGGAYVTATGAVIKVDDFERLITMQDGTKIPMQEAGYEIKTGKYISFRAEGQERFTRSKTIGENYTEERIKERIAGRTPRRSQRQATPKGISLIGDIQERIRLIDSKGYEYKAKLTILKEAARTLNYLTENNLLQYADLEKKVEDVHSSYDRTGKELKGVEARLREVQPLIKNISNYQRLKPVYDAFQKAKDKPSFKAKHEAELVIFEAARSTLLAMQGDEKLPSLKTLQAEQQRLLEEQQRLYDERAKLKKEARMIDTLKANVDDFLKPNTERDQEHQRNSQRE